MVLTKHTADRGSVRNSSKLTGRINYLILGDTVPYCRKFIQRFHVWKNIGHFLKQYVIDEWSSMWREEPMKK